MNAVSLNLVLLGLLYLVLIGLAVWGGYWVLRVAVRHGMRDHHEWVRKERALRDAYLRGDYDDEDETP